ncbi:hypothetical protein GGE65_008193 [Skermanella aerolata]|uniref:hypothetical protein n=1 Tax=Skermanella aerolata TaxID=393310 RepID=UPI003D252406
MIFAPFPSFARIVLLSLLLSGGGVAAQQPSVAQILMGFFGIGANPSSMRPADDVDHGELWTVHLETGVKRRLAPERTLHSPIFLPGGDIIALEGQALMRIPASGDDAFSITTINDVLKLVASKEGNHGQVLLVLSDQTVAILSLKDGTLNPVSLDWSSTSDVESFAQLMSWDRYYDDIHLRVIRRVITGFSGRSEQTDVFLVRGHGEPQNLSGCGERSCGQPSLSFERDKVAFIKMSSPP